MHTASTPAGDSITTRIADKAQHAWNAVLLPAPSAPATTDEKRYQTLAKPHRSTTGKAILPTRRS